MATIKEKSTNAPLTKVSLNRQARIGMGIIAKALDTVVPGASSKTRAQTRREAARLQAGAIRNVLHEQSLRGYTPSIAIYIDLDLFRFTNNTYSLSKDALIRKRAKKGLTADLATSGLAAFLGTPGNTLDQTVYYDGIVASMKRSLVALKRVFEESFDTVLTENDGTNSVFRLNPVRCLNIDDDLTGAVAEAMEVASGDNTVGYRKSYTMKFDFANPTFSKSDGLAGDYYGRAIGTQEDIIFTREMLTLSNTPIDVEIDIVFGSPDDDTDLVAARSIAYRVAHETVEPWPVDETHLQPLAAGIAPITMNLTDFVRSYSYYHYVARAKNTTGSETSINEVAITETLNASSKGDVALTRSLHNVVIPDQGSLSTKSAMRFLWAFIDYRAYTDFTSGDTGNDSFDMPQIVSDSEADHIDNNTLFGAGWPVPVPVLSKNYTRTIDVVPETTGLKPDTEVATWLAGQTAWTPLVTNWFELNSLVRLSPSLRPDFLTL